MAQQISVFLEDTPGQLKQVTSALAGKNINMHALFVSGSNDFGIARIICDKTEAAVDALKEAGFSVTTTSVIAVEIPDTPGALSKLFEVIADANIDINYTYCLVDPRTKKAINFCRLKSARAAKVIEDAGFTIFGDSVFHDEV